MAWTDANARMTREYRQQTGRMGGLECAKQRKGAMFIRKQCQHCRGWTNLINLKRHEEKCKS